MNVVCDLSQLVSVFRLVIWGLGAVAIALLTPPNAFAQLTPDSTLGSESSTVVPDSTINGAPAVQIEGGAARGENLFHSFDQFNVDEGQRVYFANPAGISTILNRVTGNNLSDILGTLGVNGGADLFFINPNGVIFGPNATLDVNGSAVFSTAESLLFNDNVVFSAVSPQAPPLLTVSAPVGLQYGSNPGGIIVQGDGHGLRFASLNGIARVVRDARSAGLQAPPNHTLALVGGDLDLQGGNVTVESGRLELGSVAAGSRVTLSPVRSGWALDYAGVENFQDIHLTQAASADASGNSDIQVVGRQIVLTEGAAIVAEPLGAEATGLFSVQAADLVRLTGNTGHADFSSGLFLSGLYAQSGPTSSGEAGDLMIETRQLQVQDSALVTADNFGSGRGRNLVVNASDAVTIQNGFVFADTFGGGAGGNLGIQAQRIQLQEGAQISATTGGSGAGGNVDIQAQWIQLRENAQILAGAVGAGEGGNVNIQAQWIQLQESAQISAGALGSGPGGNVDIQAHQLQVLSGAQVGAATFGPGDGGRLAINAQQIELSGMSADGQFASGLFTTSRPRLPRASGNAGDLTIITDQLLLGEEAEIAAETFSNGAGGNVDIQAQRIQLQEAARISANTVGSGAGGNVAIQAQQLQVLSGAQVLAGTRGSGDAGRLDINVQQIELRGTSADGRFPSAFATTSHNVGPGESGNAGDLTIIADQLLLNELARIAANANSRGNGGDINISARSQLTVNDRAAITVNSTETGSAGNIRISSDVVLLDNGLITAQTESGDGGDIVLQSDDLLLLRNSSLISSTAGSAQAGGDGGNIWIDAGFIVAVAEENSDITANAFEGRGGNISINTQGMLGIEVRDNLTPLSDITASSELGQDGLVAIDAPNTIAGADTVELPDELVDASEQIEHSLCAGEGNEFTASGRGGLPASPYGALNGQVTWEDWYIAESSSLPSTANAVDIAKISEQASLDESSAAAASSQMPPIVEAQGWVKDARGNVVLTASVATAIANGLSDGVSCQQLRESLE